MPPKALTAAALTVFLVLPLTAAGAAAASATYTVRPGDTLFAIAQEYHVSVTSLEQANGIGESGLIRIGQVLRLPGAGGASAASGPSTYVVQAGDTLSSIAQRLGVALPALEAANGLGATSVLQIGQRLTVPGAGAAASGSGTAFTGTYIVQPGDTLSAIAQKLGVSVAALEAANGLDGASILEIGETLHVPGAGSRPETSAPAAFYRVRPGDTLSSIAARFGVSLEALYRLNGLGPNSVLQVGQRVQIRGGAAAPRQDSVEAARGQVGGTYRVHAGDTLSGIAATHGISLAALMELNPGVNAADLQVGSRLQLPGRAEARHVTEVAAVPSVSSDLATSFGSRVAAEVQRFLGVPYVWGGTSPSGFDCSGLVQYVFGQLGVSIPRDATDQYYAGTPVARDDLEPGDVVFFDTEGGISHDGIYIGNGEFVDAPAPGQFVEVDNLYNPYWAATFIGARALGPMS